MVADFTLRAAAPGDVGDIARLVRALAAFERLEDQAVATPEDFQRELFGPTPRAHAMLALRQGQAVGVAIWFYNFSTFTGKPGLYVEDVFVEPAHRGHGIGRAFFAALARRALAEGCGRMEWWVLNWNESAIGFYRAMGAVGMSDWTVQRLTLPEISKLAEG
jgi:diamine N-acetyltransferase